MQLCARRWTLHGSKRPNATKSISPSLPPAYHVRSVVAKAVATPNRLSGKAFQEPQLALVALPGKAGYSRVTVDELLAQGVSDVEVRVRLACKRFQ